MTRDDHFVDAGDGEPIRVEVPSPYCGICGATLPDHKPACTKRHPDYFDSPRFVELVYLREVVRARWQESERVPVSSVLNLIDAMPDCGETFYTQAAVDQAFNRGFFKGRDTAMEDASS